MEGLVAEGRDLTAAWRGMYGQAENGGRLLRQEYDAWQARLRARPSDTPGLLSRDDEAVVAYIVAGWARRPRQVS